MAQVNVAIHGKVYGIACDDGQERRVQELAGYVDMRLREIAGAIRRHHRLENGADLDLRCRKRRRDGGKGGWIA